MSNAIPTRSPSQSVPSRCASFAFPKLPALDKVLRVWFERIARMVVIRPFASREGRWLWATSLLLFVSAFAFVSPSSFAQESPGTIADRVSFDQKLGDKVPLAAEFRDEQGRQVTLGQYFGKRPVILTLVYYNCPLLCTQVLNALTRSLKPLSINLGKDFDIVTVSIDPAEDAALSSAKKAAYLSRYNRPGPDSERGWHFLTGTQKEIDSLANSVGFRYSYNPRTKLYAHAAGIVILSPSGRITRYFYGIDYPAKDVQYVLKEASEERVGPPISRILLLCYDYDAATGKYTLSILRLLRIAGIATAVGVATFMAIMFLRDRRGLENRPLGDSSAAGTSDLSTP